MAGNIKGITIEFNGDTTKLDKALRDIDKSTKTIDSELKNVNKALKFNTNNIDLWKQKQTLLTQKIDETKKKLDVLKQAQKNMDASGVDKNSAEYRQLQREIIETESKLKHFTAEQKKVQAMISPLGQASMKFKEVGSSLENAGQKMRAFSAAAAVVVGALGAMTVKAAKAADDINTMSKVYSISTRDLQKYSLAAEQVDVSVETIAKSHVRLEKNMLSASKGSKNQADAFKKLGVEYKNTDGSLRDGDAVWQDVIKALGKMTNETERDAYAMQLMGKSAAELNPLIEDGGEAYSRLGELFDKYDLDYIDQKTLDKANEFNDLLDDTKSIGALMVQTVGANLTAVLAPALAKVVDLVGKIAGWLANLNPKVLAVIGVVAGIIAVGAPLLIGLGKLAFAISSIMSLASTLGITLGALAGPIGIVIAVIAALVAAGVLLYKNWDTIKAKAVELKNKLVNTWENIKAKTKEKFEAIKEAIVKPFETARNKIHAAIQKIKDIINNAKLALPKFKLPHFVISGGKIPWGIGGQGTKPTIDVKWYGNGTIFKKPTLLSPNVGVGERGAEAIIPLYGREMKPFAKAIAEDMKSNESTGNTYNFYNTFEAHDLEDVLTVQKFIELMRRQSAFV